MENKYTERSSVDNGKINIKDSNKEEERLDNLFKQSIVTEMLGIEYERVELPNPKGDFSISTKYNETLIKIMQYITGKESYLETYEIIIENAMLSRDVFCPWDSKLVNKYLIDLNEHVKIPTRHIHLDEYITFIQLISILSKFNENTFIITIPVYDNDNFYIMYKDGKIVDIDLFIYNINVLYTLPVSDIIILFKMDDKDVEYIRNETNKFASILSLFDIPVYNINDSDDSLIVEDEIINTLSDLSKYGYKKTYEKLLQISLELAKNGDFVPGVANNHTVSSFMNTELKDYRHLNFWDGFPKEKWISCLEFMIRNKKGKFLITSNNTTTLFIYDNGVLKYPFDNTDENILLHWVTFINKLVIEPVWSFWYTDIDKKDIYFF